MIYFVEPNKKWNAHAIINACMLDIILLNKENLKVEVYGAGSHFKNIKNSFPNNLKVAFFPLCIIDGSAKSWIIKEILEIYNLFRIMLKAKNAKVKFVYIASIFPIAHFFFKIMMKAFPTVNVIIGLHGELEFLGKYKELKLKFLGFFVMNALRIKGNSNATYLIFGESIKHNIIKSNIVFNNKLIAIDHPYIYKPYDLVNNSESSPLKFGAIGLATINKNTHFIFKLAEELKSAIQLKKIDFSIVGTISAELYPFANSYVSYSKSTNSVDREVFETEIQSLDYSLYFYDNSFYRFSASGALFDAISFEKPIIALHNDFFDYYFEKLGNIGYLFENLYDMKIKIQSIINGECKEEYLQMVTLMKNAKKKLTIENIARNFWEQIEL